jgi:hypothetical protein
MIAYNMPNPFMPAPTAPTPESRRMVERMLETIGSTKKPKTRTQRKTRVITKRR